MTAQPQQQTIPATDIDGVITDLAAEDYHAHPALSSTGARRILVAPALYRHETDNPPQSTATFDFGKAVHTRVLGAGEAVEVLDFPDYKTKAAQQAKAEAAAAGRVPILIGQWETVEGMAAALAAAELETSDGVRFPVTSLFTDGAPEQSLFWTDRETGVRCRARVDWLPNPRRGRRFVVVDYKTAASADPADFSRAVDDYGYHVQHVWYLDGVRACGLADDPAFVFVVQEKKPPYLVSVCQLGPDSVALGRAMADRARRLFAECVRTGRWPGYGERVHPIDVPPWAFTREQEQESE